MFFTKLLILFVIVPVTELYILIEVGKRIGSLTTIGIIIFTGILGAYLVKNQGFMILKTGSNYPGRRYITSYSRFCYRYIGFYFFNTR